MHFNKGYLAYYCILFYWHAFLNYLFWLVTKYLALLGRTEELMTCPQGWNNLHLVTEAYTNYLSECILLDCPKCYHRGWLTVHHCLQWQPYTTHTYLVSCWKYIFHHKNWLALTEGWRLPVWGVSVGLGTRQDFCVSQHLASAFLFITAQTHIWCQSTTLKKKIKAKKKKSFKVSFMGTTQAFRAVRSN